jgi:hypothetical protein
MTPENGAGWFPRLSPDGMIACGNKEVFVGRPGAWQSLGAGNSPEWNGHMRVVFNREKSSVLTTIGLPETVIPSGGFNEMSSSLDGRWNGYRPPHDGLPPTVIGYDGVHELTPRWADISLVKLSPNGQHSVYTDRPQEDEKTLIVDNVPLWTGKVTGYYVGDSAVCWTTADRKVLGLIFGQTSVEDWTVLPWEAPLVVDTPLGPWIYSNTQTGFILRPAGRQKGYIHTGDVFYPDCKFIDGLFNIVSSSGAGVLQQQFIDPASDRVPLVVTTPIPIPPIPPKPPEIPPVHVNIPDNVMARIREFVAAFPIPQASDEIVADQSLLDRWINDELREGWTLHLAEQLCYDFGSDYSSKGTSPSWKSKESIARLHGDKMDVWDLLKGAATGRPTFKTDPDHVYVGIEEGAHRIIVQPINHLGSIKVPTNRPTIKTPMWALSSFDLATRLDEGDRRWIDQMLLPASIIARLICASYYRRPAGEDAWTTQQKLDISRTRFRAALAVLKADGLTCEPTLLCDTDKFKLSRAEALDEVRKLNPILVEFAEQIRGVSGGNELSHDGEAAYMRDPSFHDEVEAILDPRFPYTPGAGHGGEGVQIFPSASYCVHHADRSKDAVTNAAIMKRGQDIAGRPVQDREQIGVADRSLGQTGQRVYDADYLVTSVREAIRLGLAGVTYHPHAGLTANVDLLGPTQRDAWQQFVTLIGGKPPVKEQEVKPEQIAQVVAGLFFEKISTLLKLPAGTQETRRPAIHKWTAERVVFLEAAYQRIFKRSLDLEGAGSWVLHAINGKTDAWIDAELVKAYARGDR